MGASASASASSSNGKSSNNKQLNNYTFPRTTIGSVVMLTGLGIMLLVLGVYLYKVADHKYEQTIVYDDSSRNSNSAICKLAPNNVTKQCLVSFHIDVDEVKAPLWLYYRVTNVYQNHRRYVESRDIAQLQGKNQKESDVSLTCSPLLKNGTRLLNPCGLISNNMFSDVIVYNATQSFYNGSDVNKTNVFLNETNIALASDIESLFKQVDGFQYQQVTSSNTTCPFPSCKTYVDPKTSNTYLFYYPDEDSVQYLYESYPNIISPIEGVTNEHFIVWMRTSGLPSSRKLYGRVEVSSNRKDNKFVRGDIISFDVESNFDVSSFDGTKALVLMSPQVDLTIDSAVVAVNGNLVVGKNYAPGATYIFTGLLLLVTSVVMLMRHYLIF